ncbi:MAG: ribosomal-protein-alanine N-acetyltransferase [Geobacter sp.]|nr:ribosomal-protein-alanine N-acetyltransferase [Geobacter sp.]
MTAAELPQIIAIERLSYPLPWSEQHFLDELSSRVALPLVALDAEGAVLGYICAMQVLDEGHILNVAVAPEARGKGIGRLLCERVLADCRAADAAFVSLEVRVSNHSAIELYQRIGFVECGRRKRYYENGEDAIMMEFIY